jgi:anti-sigma factor ChrR (cupin superfamily)
MSAPTPTCDQTERVAEYALRSLPADEATAFEAHLPACAACRGELDALRPVIDALVDWPQPIARPPHPLWPELAQRIGAEPGDAEARWTDEPAWNEVAPGISCKLLSTDEDGYVTMLVHLAPGVAYPPHEHAAVEELHLLDGELWIDDRKLYPGDYSRGEPGTGDTRVWSETGCTCVLMTSSRDRLR